MPQRQQGICLHTPYNSYVHYSNEAFFFFFTGWQNITHRTHSNKCSHNKCTLSNPLMSCCSARFAWCLYSGSCAWHSKTSSHHISVNASPFIHLRCLIYIMRGHMVLTSASLTHWQYRQYTSSPSVFTSIEVRFAIDSVKGCLRSVYIFYCSHYVFLLLQATKQ